MPPHPEIADTPDSRWLPFALGAVALPIAIGLAAATEGTGRLLAMGLALTTAGLLACTVHRSRLATTRAHRLADCAREREAARLEARDHASRAADANAVVEQLETFNYTVSHDLRSPLGAILNFSAVLEEDKAEELGDDGRAVLERIKKNALSAVEMMETLLVYSRVSRRELAIEPVTLTPLIHEAVQATGGSVDGGPRAEVDGDVPPVRGDRELLRTAMKCLVQHTCAAPGEPRSLHVESALEGDQVEVRVHDAAARITPRREPGAGAREERLEAHGIHLATVSRVVSRLGGRAWIEPWDGAGATFHLRFLKG